MKQGKQKQGMKKHIAIRSLLLLLAVAGTQLFRSCEKAEDSPGIGTILFEEKMLTIEPDETVQLHIRIFRSGSTTGEAYDTAANPYDLRWSSSAPKIASVDTQGRVTGHTAGTATIRCESPDGSVSAATGVTVRRTVDGSTAENLSQTFSKALVYSQSVYLERNSVMQCFDVENDGTLWYMQLGGNDPELIYVLRGTPNQSPRDFMTLRWFGHGTNFAVEESGADRYIWVGSNGNKLSDGSYSQSNTVSRVKYEAGKRIDLSSGETFFIKNKWNVHPAIDTKNDVLCITASTTGVRDFYFYRLSEALATPLSRVTLRKQTYGGEDADTPQKTETRTIEAHDLTSVTPIGSFTTSIPGIGNLCQYDFQGFDVQDGLLYFFEGEAVNKQPKSIAFVTVLDMTGRIVVPRTRIQAIEDEAALVAAGICGSDAKGYMEAEGIKMKHGNLYLGFASHGPGAKRWANVFRY